MPSCQVLAYLFLYWVKVPLLNLRLCMSRARSNNLGQLGVGAYISGCLLTKLFFLLSTLNSYSLILFFFWIRNSYSLIQHPRTNLSQSCTQVKSLLQLLKRLYICELSLHILLEYVHTCFGLSLSLHIILECQLKS